MTRCSWGESHSTCVVRCCCAFFMMTDELVKQTLPFGVDCIFLHSDQNHSNRRFWVFIWNGTDNAWCFHATAYLIGTAVWWLAPCPDIDHLGVLLCLSSLKFVFKNKLSAADQFTLEADIFCKRRNVCHNTFMLGRWACAERKEPESNRVMLFT